MGSTYRRKTAFRVEKKKSRSLGRAVRRQKEHGGEASITRRAYSVPPIWVRSIPFKGIAGLFEDEAGAKQVTFDWNPGHALLAGPQGRRDPAPRPAAVDDRDDASGDDNISRIKLAAANETLAPTGATTVGDSWRRASGLSRSRILPCS
ncbi:MAG: hypothetical protein ACJ79U_17660 [Myxococcales bacterium]